MPRGRMPRGGLGWGQKALCAFLSATALWHRRTPCLFVCNCTVAQTHTVPICLQLHCNLPAYLT
eukprot:1008362-Pelagomonas_calceolata.AAC.6